MTKGCDEKSRNNIGALVESLLYPTNAKALELFEKTKTSIENSCNPAPTYSTKECEILIARLADLSKALAARKAEMNSIVVCDSADLGDVKAKITFVPDYKYMPKEVAARIREKHDLKGANYPGRIFIEIPGQSRPAIPYDPAKPTEFKYNGKSYALSNDCNPKLVPEPAKEVALPTEVPENVCDRNENRRNDYCTFVNTEAACRGSNELKDEATARAEIKLAAKNYAPVYGISENDIDKFKAAPEQNFSKNKDGRFKATVVDFSDIKSSSSFDPNSPSKAEIPETVTEQLKQCNAWGRFKKGDSANKLLKIVDSQLKTVTFVCGTLDKKGQPIQASQSPFVRVYPGTREAPKNYLEVGRGYGSEYINGLGVALSSEIYREDFKNPILDRKFTGSASALSYNVRAAVCPDSPPTQNRNLRPYNVVRTKKTPDCALGKDFGTLGTSNCTPVICEASSPGGPWREEPNSSVSLNSNGAGTVIEQLTAEGQTQANFIDLKVQGEAGPSGACVLKPIGSLTSYVGKGFKIPSAVSGAGSNNGTSGKQ